MKKALFGFLAAVSVTAMVQTPALAHEYNPFDNMYRAEAKRAEVVGQAQFVYLLKDAAGNPLAGAALEYVDREGTLYSVTADAEGRVKLLFTSGNPFVQLRNVVAEGRVLQAIGEDITADADAKDLRKGEVEYFVLQQDAQRNIVYVYDAD